jgi:hypothetical protein
MKKLTILLFAIASVAAGCKKFTENINNNLNQPTVVTPNVVLSAALVASGSSLANDFLNTNRWMCYWARSGNYIETIPTETYVLDPSYADGEFEGLYGTMTRYNYIQNNSAGDPFYVGVAQVMKAFHFATLVDAFNSIPYSQAFNLAKYPAPKYDDAATIYASLVQQCDSAVISFQKATTYYSGAPSTTITLDDKYDVMFGRGAGVDPTTRMNEWIRFTNTVKLRLLMTARTATSVSAFSKASIMAELAKVTANGQGFIGPNQSASINPGYSNSQAAQQNPIYGGFYLTSGTANNNFNFFRANQYYINYGNNTGDPRFTDNYQIVLSGAPYCVGNYDGDPNPLSNTFTSGIGSGKATSTTGPIQNASQDEFIMSDFESLFWQAEAAQEGYIAGSAADFAKQGTEQSFIYVNDTGSGDNGQNITDADNFLAGDAGDPKTDVSVGGLQAVMTLKWAALNTINWEQAYTDYRRTGYPVPDNNDFGFSRANNVFKHAMLDVTGKNQPINFPFRYLYPQSEINTNNANIPSGTSAYTTIFWDTREK